MPITSRRDGHRAMIAEVRAAGYRPRQSDLSEREIEAYLREHPDLVAAWCGYSADQRSSPNWYLLPPDASFEPSQWRVGYHAGEAHPERPFADGFEACAFLVARKVEEHFAGWFTRARRRRDALSRLVDLGAIDDVLQGFADDLERLSQGELSAEDIRAKYWQPSTPDVVERIMSYVEHYLADSDIRERDSEYREMQEGEMGKLIRLLRSRGSWEAIRRISFLGRSRD